MAWRGVRCVGCRFHERVVNCGFARLVLYFFWWAIFLRTVGHFWGIIRVAVVFPSTATTTVTEAQPPITPPFIHPRDRETERERQFIPIHFRSRSRTTNQPSRLRHLSKPPPLPPSPFPHHTITPTTSQLTTPLPRQRNHHPPNPAPSIPHPIVDTARGSYKPRHDAGARAHDFEHAIAHCGDHFCEGAEWGDVEGAVRAEAFDDER